MENELNASDQGEKKPKRPRITAQPAAEASGTHARYDSYRRAPQDDDREHNTYPRRAPYQQRQHDGENTGYQPRYNNNNRYGNNGANRYPRRSYDYNRPSQDAEGAEGTEGSQQGYQQRRPAYPRQGNYQPRYNNNGGNRYDNNNGGYQPRYNNNNRYDRSQGTAEGDAGEGQHGGYQPRRYNNNGGNRYGGNGGYQPRYNNNNRYERNDGEAGEGQQGGYQPRRYNNNGGGNRYNNGGNRYGGNNNRYGNNSGGNRRQAQNGFPARGKSFTPRPKRIEYEQPVPDPNEEIRLNKYMANAGLCSRREADEFIQQGLVKVNGQVVTELGTKITAKDVVEYDDKVVTLESKCYILLNKPKDCVTTSDDPNGRTTVLDLVKGACNERIYPVGRLDRNTTGVLLLTNDGDLASKLTHPKYVKKKIYHVWCDKDISEDDMQRIADGIELEDGPIHADAISYATETDRNQAGIEIHSGRNRIVRRIFESLGYHVTKLDRVYFAGLTKKNLPRGRWRYLTQEEVNFLKMGSFE